MATSVEEQNVRTFRDFLYFYNIMSESCFTSCVSTLNSRKLLPTEEECVDRCANKFIRFNHRAIALYADAQGKLVEKRMKDLEAEQGNKVADVVASTAEHATEDSLPSSEANSEDK